MKKIEADTTTLDTLREEFAAARSEDGVETAPEVAQEAAQEAVPEPAAATQKHEEAPEVTADKPRRPDGKFAKAQPAPVKPAAAVAEIAAAAIPKLKAPADWRPGAAAKFDSLPREAQEEAIRLHVETKKTLQEAAGHRQTAETWQKTVAPYEHMFRASGKTAQEGVGWLVQQYAALQTAPIPQRAAIVAGLIRDFIGVDEQSINLLASQLEGKPTPAPQTPQAIRPEQVQEMVRQQLAQERQQAAHQAEEKAIADFEASAPEFLDTEHGPAVTRALTVLAGMERQQGKPLTVEMLKQLHDQVIHTLPATAAILKQRDDAAAAEKTRADEAKKRAAASGIKNEPAGRSGSAAEPMNTKEQLRYEFARARNSRV